MKTLLTACIFLLVMSLSSLRAESQQVTFIFNQVDKSQYFIETMNLHKHYAKLNAPFSFKRDLYKVDLRKGSDTVKVPIEHFYASFALDYVANNASGEWTNSLNRDVPRNQPFLALSGDTLVFDFEFSPSKNPKFPTLNCKISGSTRNAFYIFQLNPQPIEKINDEIRHSGGKMVEEGNSDAFLAFLDSCVREVRAITEALCRDWDIEPYLSDIVVASRVSTAFGLGLGQLTSRSRGITDASQIAMFSKITEQMDPLKWFEGIEEEAVGESYFVTSPWYRYINYKAALEKFKPGMTFNPYAVSNNSAKEVYDRLRLIQQDHLRSKLLWNWFVYKTNEEGLHVADYRPELDGLLVEPYRTEVLTKPAYKDYTFADMEGEIRNISEFTGKVVLMDFWFTGCRGCIQMKNALEKAEAILKSDTDIVFLNVNADMNKGTWLRSVEGGQYSTDHAIKLYTQDQGRSHEFLSDYNVNSYPSLFVIDKDGVIQEGFVPDPRIDMDGFIDYIRSFT